SLEPRAEGIDRVALAGEVDAATQADPLDLRDQMAEAFLDAGQHFVEQIEATILTVVVEHETADLADHLLDLRRIVLAQAAERTRRIGQQIVGAAHLRVDAQTTDGALGLRLEALQLADG